MATRGKGDNPAAARPSRRKDGLARPAPAALASPSTLRPTLLIVDDHAGSLNLLALEIKEWPDMGRFELELATSGRKAVDFIERSYLERRPVFVLCDVRMAGLTGIDVLTAIVGRSTAPFRFVLTTAGDHPDMREQAFALGADDFILKTNEPGQLWEALNGRLNRWLRACENPVQA